MNETRDLLERVGERYAFPKDAFERLGRRRDRRRRNQRISAGVVGGAVFVAMVWLVATGASLPRTGPGNTPSTTPTHPADVGLVGLPPEGATPSTPRSGELVLDLAFGRTGGDPGRFGLQLYADGRVIWQRLGLPGEGFGSTGLIEQRLTPGGVDLVLAEVLSTGLLDRDRVLVGAFGLPWGWIEVRTDAGIVDLTWGDAGFEEGDDPIETVATEEQVHALERLDARLEDLDSWLPASAWEGRDLMAYVPSRYSVCYSGEDEALGRSRILDLLPAAAADPLRTLETTQGEFQGGRGPVPYWCSVVTTADARELARVIEDAGASEYSPLGPVYALSSEGGLVVVISFDPVLPHDWGRDRDEGGSR